MSWVADDTLLASYSIALYCESAFNFEAVLKLDQACTKLGIKLIVADCRDVVGWMFANFQDHIAVSEVCSIRVRHCKAHSLALRALPLQAFLHLHR